MGRRTLFTPIEAAEIRLRYHKDRKLTFRQIAAETGVSPDTVGAVVGRKGAYGQQRESNNLSAEFECEE